MSREKMSDTGERKAIAEEAATAAANKVAGMSQTPYPGDSAAHMYRIAEEVVERSEPAHILKCEKEGPACELGNRIKDVEDRLKIMETESAESRGAFKQNSRNTTLIVAVATGISVLVQIFVAVMKLKHG